jgi:transcriptional regulator with XRE-family HTH domain
VSSDDQALGAVLRTWRDRTDPAAVGLPHNSPRRAPGLRREELALLAGISIDYVVRLEQGRASTPSAQVCTALARALQLSDAEQAHLLRLAGHAEGGGRVPRAIPASVRRIVEHLDDHPVSVYDAMWNLLSWNRLYAAVLGDPSLAEPAERNAVVRQFTNPPTRVRYTPQEEREFEASLTSDLRATTGRYPRDPELAAFVARMLRVERFAALWEHRRVGGHQQSHKIVVHPEVGDIDLDCDTLTTQGSDLRVLVLTPRPGSDARGRLDLLAALGTQDLAVPAGS